MRIIGNSGVGEAGERLAQAANHRPRIVVIQGSARNEGNCPGQFGKTRAIMAHAMKGAAADFDVVDLSVKNDGEIVQPCKACVSTSSFHCHAFCDCYSKGDKRSPDLMHNQDVYGRLAKADAFVVFTPINWYAPTSVVKSFFDRLVCINMTITAEQAKQLTGDDVKNMEKTRALEQGGEHDHLRKNHFEGKYAAFFVHGDDGANDYAKTSPPESLAVMLRDGSEGRTNNPAEAIAPIVWQCRYSGIHVPEDLVVGAHVNKGISYSDANDKYATNERLFSEAAALMGRLLGHINKA